MARLIPSKKINSLFYQYTEDEIHKGALPNFISVVYSTGGLSSHS